MLIIHAAVFPLCSENVLKLPNPAFHPDTVFKEPEEKADSVKSNDDETTTDGGKFEKEMFKMEYGTLV